MTDVPVVYIVDDDADSRDSAAVLLSQMALRVEAFASAAEFLEAYDGYRPGCLLTDHRMMGMSGVELLEELRNRGITLSVILMTAYAETSLTVRAIRSGAVSLIEKPFTDTALWNAVHEALAEDSRQAAEETKIRRMQAALDSLTEAEKDVLDLVVKGEPNKAIAMTLDVSVRTVENRRRSVFEKLNVTSVAELVQFVMTVRGSA